MSKKIYRCPECRTRRPSFTAMIDHCRQHEHKLCGCGGYHFKHRPGSPMCVQNPMSVVHMAIRAGDCSNDDLLDLAIDCAMNNPGRRAREWPEYLAPTRRV